MPKLRSAYYCNLKLLLIFLVVLGHWIEPEIGTSPVLNRVYRTIYLFHMPLFAFLSGLFLKDRGGCIRQLRRMAPVYLLCQSAAVGLDLTAWHTPWWTLWYLLSLCFWLLAAWLLLGLPRGKWAVLALTIALGCLSGRTEWVGRPLSLSRTIVFFPYFWLGVLVPADVPWHRFRLPALLALPVLAVNISAVTLYHAGPCEPLTRLRCYAVAGALGLLVLSWCPRRRFPWTRAGADTMAAYLLHGPLIRLLPPVPYPALATAALLCIIHKATQWHRPYGIIGKEECPCEASKNYTKPRARRSTASS